MVGLILSYFDMRKESDKVDIESMIPKLIRVGFEDDKRAFEVISISIANRMKKRILRLQTR